MTALRCLALASACLVVAASIAQADPVHYYGNTLEIRRSGKLAGRILYNADHTYTMFTGAGQTVPGHWTAVGGKLCLEPNDASLPTLALCVPDDPTHKLGDHWVVASPAGTPEALTLVAGQMAVPIRP